jgi:hypothetical protein
VGRPGGNYGLHNPVPGLVNLTEPYERPDQQTRTSPRATPCEQVPPPPIQPLDGGR